MLRDVIEDNGLFCSFFQNMPSHKNTASLGNALIAHGWPEEYRKYCCLIILELNLYCLTNNINDGNLGSLTNTEILLEAKLPPSLTITASEFTDALKNSGYLDQRKNGHLCIHNFEAINEPFLRLRKKKEDSRKRKREQRKREKEEGASRGMSQGRSRRQSRSLSSKCHKQEREGEREGLKEKDKKKISKKVISWKSLSGKLNHEMFKKIYSEFFRVKKRRTAGAVSADLKRIDREHETVHHAAFSVLTGWSKVYEAIWRVERNDINANYLRDIAGDAGLLNYPEMLEFCLTGITDAEKDTGFQSQGKHKGGEILFGDEDKLGD